MSLTFGERGYLCYLAGEGVVFCTHVTGDEYSNKRSAGRRASEPRKSSLAACKVRVRAESAEFRAVGDD